MNQDTIWMIIRYLIIAGGGYLGWFTQDQLVQIAGAIGTLFGIAWGIWVKWDTTPVKDTVILAKNVPTVNSATGTTEPAPTNRRS